MKTKQVSSWNPGEKNSRTQVSVHWDGGSCGKGEKELDINPYLRGPVSVLQSHVPRLKHRESEGMLDAMPGLVRATKRSVHEAFISLAELARLWPCMAQKCACNKLVLGTTTEPSVSSNESSRTENWIQSQHPSVFAQTDTQRGYGAVESCTGIRDHQ